MVIMKEQIEKRKIAMIKISKEQKEFEELCKPLIKFLNDNYNPHCHILIDLTSAEIVSGEMAFYTEKYLKD